MTEIRVRSLSCTKINESETETENGTKTKYTYTFQDEDKDNTITFKTDYERDFTIGQKIDVLITSDQKKLDDFAVEVEVKTEEEPTFLPESIKNTPGAVEALKEAQDLIDTMDEEIEKKNPGCRYWYSGGLCANSTVKEPLCPGLADCTATPEERTGESGDHMDAKEEDDDDVCPKTGAIEDCEIHGETCTDCPEGKEGSITKTIREMLKEKSFDKVFDYPTTKKGETVIREITVGPLHEGWGTYWVDEDDRIHKIGSRDLPIRKTVEEAVDDFMTFVEKKKLRPTDWDEEG